MQATISHQRVSSHAAFETVAPPKRPDQPAKFSNDLLDGFIKHPERFPLQFRRLRFWEQTKTDLSQRTNMGLSFNAESYQKPGSILEITIPTRKETHQFLGKVVMVKETTQGFETGVWLLNLEDVPKLRIVEQICHIELYLNDKRYQEGPFMSREKLTEEWISRFAGSFPVN